MAPTNAVGHQYRRYFLPGAEIFAEGEKGDEAFIIESGQIEISRRRGEEKVVLATLGPGEIFGEMALIDDAVRSASATALTETELIVISREQIQTKLKAADPITGLLLRLLLGRMRSMQRIVTGEKARKDGQEPIEDYAEHYQRARERLTFEQELDLAIAERQFHMVFQPIVAISDGAVAGFESLIRWRHPRRGFVSPEEFVHLAEETGRIIDIDRWMFEAVLETAARIHAALQGTGAALPFVSLNLSSIRFADDKVVSDLAAAASKVGIAPGRIKVELTEGALIDNPQMALVVIKGFKDMGATVAIDDFGTGYSSLSYLHRFPIDTLKIDKSFVRDMVQNASSLKIVRAVIGLAQALGMNVVAEGVESEDEARLLDEMRCDFIQGYLYSKPLLPEQAVEFALARPALAEH